MAWVVYLSICPSSTFPSIHMSTCPHVHLTVCHTCPPSHLSICQPVQLSNCPTFQSSNCQPVHRFTCLPVHLSLDNFLFPAKQYIVRLKEAYKPTFCPLPSSDWLHIVHYPMPRILILEHQRNQIHNPHMFLDSGKFMSESA